MAVIDVDHDVDVLNLYQLPYIVNYFAKTYYIHMVININSYCFLYVFSFIYLFFKTFVMTNNADTFRNTFKST